MKEELKTTDTDSPKNGVARGLLDTLVIRFLFLFTHLYLGFIHFFIVDEGRLFFGDESAGRKRRLKQEKIKTLFPNLRKR